MIAAMTDARRAVDAAPELAGGTVPQGLRVSRCVQCDNAYAWKGAAARPGCPVCGGQLTTTTRNLKRSTFTVLDGELLAYAELLPTGLEREAEWHDERARRDEERARELELEAEQPETERNPNLHYAHGPAQRAVWTRESAEKHHAKAARYRGRRARLEAAR